jgi:hypothetical protein
MAHVFNELSQKILPKVFGKLSGVGLTDLMDVVGQVTTAGTGGGRIKTKTETVYCGIPVIFDAGGGSKAVQRDQLTSETGYMVKFPSHNENGTRYAINPETHRLRVKSRTFPGDEPAKVFRIISLKDMQGNLYEAMVIREGVE